MTNTAVLKDVYTSVVAILPGARVCFRFPGLACVIEQPAGHERWYMG
ncbi:hypothetical protein ACU62C_26000 [Klebsiella aerogenes]